MILTVRAPGAGLLLALASVLPAAAQQTDTTKARRDSVISLPPIEVVGSIRPVAGPKIGSGIPARITELTGAQVDAAEPRILSDVLDQVAGFSSYDDLGSPYKLNIQTRGFFASPVVGLPQGVAVFLDGVRQNEPEAAQVNFDLLPIEHVKRVEILSGNGSLLGRNALGGAINLVTSRGEGPLSGEVEAAGGSFGSASLEGSVGGRAKNGLDYYVGSGYNREDGWRQQTGGEQYNAFVNLGRSGERSGIRLQAFGAHSRVRTAGSLPESVFLVKPDSNLTTGDYEDLNSVQLAVLGYRQLGSGRGSFNAYARGTNAERFNVNQAADPDAFGRTRSRVVGGTVDYRLATTVGALPLGLRFGADGSASWNRISLFADSTKFGGTREQTTLVESPIWDVAGFVLADLAVGRVTFSGGGRLDYVRAPYRNRLDPTKDTTNSFTRVNPRFGVDVDAGRGVSLFGSVGTAFRAPSVIELACSDPTEPCPLPFALGDDPPLEPVVATTIEAGLRYRGHGVNVSASAYRTAVKNDIFLFPYQDANAPTGSTIDGYFGNLAKTRREGVELQATYGFGPGHLLYANYAYTRATFQSAADIFSVREEADPNASNEVEPGDRLPLVPDHTAKAGASFRFENGLRAGADARFIGRQYLRGDEANQTAPLSSYFVADARVGYELGPWELTLVVNNVFDRKYASFGGYNINQGGGDVLERFLTPGHKRMFRVVLTRSFGRDRD